MKEKDLKFDQEIIEQLCEVIPPEEDLKSINPWSKPIGFITWGFILTTLKLNNLYLQYILPTIGATLVYLGFRSLRHENKYFKILWGFSIFDLLFHLIDLLVMATPLNTMNYPIIKIGILMLVIRITMYLFFQKALNKVYEKAGKEINEQPLIWVSLWSLGASIIAFSPLAQSWLAFIPMVGFYILIIRSLFKIGDQLDDTGYLLKNSPVKISGKAFGWSYFIIALIMVIGLNSYFNHLKIEPRGFHPMEITWERQELIKKGFPEEVLQYLNNENVSVLKKAINIEAISKLLMFDAKRIEHSTSSGSHTYVSHSYEPDKRNLQATTIYIEMPESEMYVMVYFTWEGGKPVWQDNFSINGDTEFDKEIVTSGLFYSKNNIEYIGDFPRISWENITIETMFGPYNANPIRAALSYPFGAKNQGGYVLYRYIVDFPEKIGNKFSTYVDFNYSHRVGPLYFPYRDAEDRPFEIIDGLQQQYTNYESLELQELEE